MTRPKPHLRVTVICGRQVLAVYRHSAAQYPVAYATVDTWRPLGDACRALRKAREFQRRQA